MSELKLKCVSLIGELNDLGKHVFLPDEGVTLCGCFTNDYNKIRYKNMPDGVTSEYNVVEWDITCKRCLEIAGLFEKHDKAKKAIQN